jgi:hypothetical protein
VQVALLLGQPRATNMLITRLSASNAVVGVASPGFNRGADGAGSTGDRPLLSARSSRNPVSSSPKRRASW